MVMNYLMDVLVVILLKDFNMLLILDWLGKKIILIEVKLDIVILVGKILWKIRILGNIKLMGLGNYHKEIVRLYSINCIKGILLLL